MWLLALVSPVYIYALPFLHARWWRLDSCPPSHVPCFEWSDGGPELRLCAVAAVLAMASVLLPVVWHRRSLARLRCRAAGGPGTLLPFSSPASAARAAVLRYAGRLAMVLVILLPIYFLAWGESGLIVYCHQFSNGSGRIVPRPEDYVPLAAILTIFTALHLPTRRRVFGALDGLWDQPRSRVA
ncbi:hypothetical protein [Polyangium sp. 15x6]|uniref:hypothetical protein n=1 Tax=Polyangium sp. 15x6 TaxID=3042687 RepID=UPI00249BA9CA|nr:hypothetical protein [Polyangium sp. 15x6]MDI3286279.1 hypothetical protein [Polyangium sp. 15x6]